MGEMKNSLIVIKEETTSTFIKVHLTANQYSLSGVKQFQLFLNKAPHFLTGKIEVANEEQVIITYEKDELSFSLEQYVKKLDEFDRLLLAQKVNFLKEYLNQPVTPFIHPKNIFIFGEELFIGHRGVMNTVIPYLSTEEVYLKQYKALLLYILNPKLDFENLIDGAGAVRDPFSEKIQESSSFEEIDKLLMETVAIQKEKRNATSILVKSRNYTVFKWGTIILGLATLGLSIGVGIYSLNIVPQQKRIISAESKFISNNYSDVLDSLKEDKPENLPKSALYVLAVSSIQLDSLSNEQKESVLGTISQKSNDNTLLYWIYIGKGDFEKSLNIAKNIGDNQYILHAYTKVYDVTNADNKMNGAKKQELLSKYKEEMEKYMKLLEGKTDDQKSKQ
ncbi:putative membrane protein essB [Bacillus mycoides]|uniref:Membrane protein essB n=1 Tax=Bacillus mycoides TaxID=1405 RepID=A0A1E8BV82_BACMY|nr:type VII secretion protein EssB [Bacillus mycoides]OFE02266.1 putative membrane protein essB [Bacillus mycoides]OFE04240.1 putative membrane protein essB [Bacillus mycoides]